jgi:hypothetical protein
MIPSELYHYLRRLSKKQCSELGLVHLNEVMGLPRLELQTWLGHIQFMEVLQQHTPFLIMNLGSYPPGHHW